MHPTQRLDRVVVLLADDNDDARSALALALEQQGAMVLQADSGEKALELLALYSPDVLLSDITISGMDGLDLIEEIRSREKTRKRLEHVDIHLPAAVITALCNAEDRSAWIKAGFLFHIPKPIKLPALFRVVANLALIRH